MRFWLDFWSKKRCFMPIVANIFDQSSDIGFIFGMCQLMIKESINGSDYCENINATYLFGLSLLFFLFYRIVSGILVFIGTKNISYGMGQFLFEYMLYRAIWVNYEMKCKKPCSPQKWLQNMESMLEAFPQLMIQMFYSIQIGQFKGFVAFSVTFSMLSIVGKVVSEDKQLFIKSKDEQRGIILSNWQDAQWGCEKCPIVNYKYLIRFMFRIFDVSHRGLIIVLVWAEFGGIIVIIVALIEFIVLFAVVIKTQELSLILSLNCVLLVAIEV